MKGTWRRWREYLFHISTSKRAAPPAESAAGRGKGEVHSGASALNDAGFSRRGRVHLRYMDERLRAISANLGGTAEQCFAPEEGAELFVLQNSGGAPVRREPSEGEERNGAR